MTSLSWQRASWRRRLSAVTAAGVAAVGLVCVTSNPAQAATESVTNASFTWGISGYAQTGVANFGPWNLSATGNATILKGSIDTANTAPQTEYAVPALNVTETATLKRSSLPASLAGRTPNAVKFTGGTGTVDPATGAGELQFTGSYTVAAYPASTGVPTETFTDPVVTTEADGSGTVKAKVKISDGKSQAGAALAGGDLGEITILTYDAGSAALNGTAGYQVTPDYQGVTIPVGLPAGPQTTSCTTDGGATGWWGAWPSDFLTALGSVPAGAAVLAHYYSTGCAGTQDTKPALPFDVRYAASTPTVTASATKVSTDGTTTVTVKGSGFTPGLAVGSRPPLAGAESGTYVVLGKVAPLWRASQGAASTTRKAVSQKWAVPSASLATIGGAAAGGIELKPDGTFETTFDVSKAVIDKAATDNSLTKYGIFTYAGGGAVVDSFETFTPISWVTPLSIAVSPKPYGTASTVTIKAAGGSGATIAVAGAGDTVNAPVGADSFANATLSSTLTPGTYFLKVSTLPDATFAASTIDAALTVARAKPVVSKKIVTKPTRKKKGKLKVTVKGTASTPVGTITVKLKKGKYTRTTKLRLINGARTLSLPKLAKGTWSYSVTYNGSTLYTKSVSSAKFKVTR